MLTYFQHFFIIKIFFDLFLYFFQLFSIQQKATKKIRLLSMLIYICAWAFPKLKPRISITYSNAALRWFWQLRVKKNGQDQLRCWLWTRFDKSISVGAQQSELCSLGWAIFSTIMPITFAYQSTIFFNKPKSISVQFREIAKTPCPFLLTILKLLF